MAPPEKVCLSALQRGRSWQKNGVEKPGASELWWNIGIYPYVKIHTARKLS